jgi:hypothetical protein
MSLKKTDVRTPGIAAIAKKWNISVAKVSELVNIGAKVEFEHNKNINKARQVARDHINERPDYYQKLKKMEKTPVSMKEETGIGGVRGLGYTSGDPAGTNYVQQYIDTNAMSYIDNNGSKLDYLKKKHIDLHNKGLGYNFFDPTNIKSSSNFMKEEKHPLQINFDKYRKGKLNELGGSGEPNAYTGLTDPRKSLEEGPKLDKAKKVAMAGLTAANMYTMADVAGRASEGGHGSPKADVVKAASSLPGAVGWGATAVHYGKKGYDLARDALKKKKAHMEEEKKMSNPCWKGYKAYGMKKKNGKEVPNCVPVEENVEESAAWQRKAGKNPEGGLNRKGIASYRRENPGSKLSMAVTTEPSKLDPDSKPAKRRKSFCARMGGMKGPMKDEKGRPTRKALALRKWNCEEDNKYPDSAERGIYEGDDREVVYTHKKGPLYGTVTQHSDGTISSRRKVGMYWRGRTHGSKESAIAHLENDGKKKKLREERIDEKAPPGAKYERMVRHIKDRLGADGLTKKEKSIAFATTWKAYNKKHMEESQIDEISDDLVGRASNAAFWKGKAPSERLSRYINRAYTRQPEKKDKKETKPKKPVKENMHDKDWDEATGKLPEQTMGTYFHPTHKHTARLSKEKAMKPDNIIEPGGVKGRVTPNMHTEQKETKMENKNLVNEAIENILENDLASMKENLMTSLQEKAQEKLEERKKLIASQYFAQ